MSLIGGNVSFTHPGSIPCVSSAHAIQKQPRKEHAALRMRARTHPRTHPRRHAHARVRVVQHNTTRESRRCVAILGKLPPPYLTPSILSILFCISSCFPLPCPLALLFSVFDDVFLLFISTTINYLWGDMNKEGGG